MGRALFLWTGTSCPEKITGRIRNLACLPNGDTFHPVFDEKTILSVAAGIKQYQFTQKDIHTIDVLIACDKPLSDMIETELTKVFNKSFFHSSQYNFIYQKDFLFLIETNSKYLNLKF